MSRTKCVRCGGLGMLRRTWVCGCALRRIARSVLDEAAFSGAVVQAYGWRRVTSGLTFSAPRAEFRTDVLSAMRRVLDEHEFRALIISAVDEWPEATKRLRISKGEYFHTLYRAEKRVACEFLRGGIFPPRRYLSAGAVATGLVRKPTRCLIPC